MAASMVPSLLGTSPLGASSRRALETFRGKWRGSNHGDAFEFPLFSRLAKTSTWPSSHPRRRFGGAGIGGQGKPVIRAEALQSITIDEITEPKSNGGNSLRLACPICHNALIYPENPLLSARKTVSFRSLDCKTCVRSFDINTDSKFVDLTITSDGEGYKDEQHAGTTIFQNPVVAFVYERGWRQGFAYAGFPGVDEEFKIAQNFLASAKNGPLLDVSCGSGLFSRRFLKSNDYSIVVASDFSESMLQQCKSFLENETSLINNKDDHSGIMLVRADVARLPFENGQLAGVHAGAAIHCWPQPASAVAEISRVLRPGGVFVGSTFLIPESDSPLVDIALEPLRQLVLKGPLDPYRWWTEKELRELFQACGLVNFQCVRAASFILFSASKPLQTTEDLNE